VVTTILDQVSRLLGQAYLVSSLTPWLMFWVANALTLACLLGPRSMHRWWVAEIDTSAPMLAAVTVVAVVFLAASALLMNVAYGLFRRTLEGDTDIPALRLLVRVSAARRRRRNVHLLQAFAAVRQHYGSDRVLAAAERAYVRAAMQQAQDSKLPDATPSDIAAFDATFNAALSVDDDRQAILEGRQAFERALLTVNGDAFTDQLGRWFERIDNLVDASAIRAAEVAIRASDVSAVSAEPSGYGEALASVSRYVSGRYGIDSIVFWSRLQPLIPAEYMTVVEGAKVRMDMLTSLTLLALMYATGWFVLLPYFAVRPGVLIAISGSGVAAAALFYAGSVEAARSFAETVRSSFDLYRHDMLKKLGFAVPASLEAEKERWNRISRFVLYRDPVDLPFAPEPEEEQDPEPPVAPPSSLETLWAKLIAIFVPSPTPPPPPAPTPPPAGSSPAVPTTLPVIPAPPDSGGHWIRTSARAIADVVVIAALLYVGRWQLERLQTPRSEHLVFGPMASVQLPLAARVKTGDLAFGIGRTDRPDEVVVDPAEIVDREVSRQVDAGAFFRLGDLHGRSLTLIKLDVTAAGPLAAGTRVDLWRANSGSGEAFSRVLSGAEIASAEAASAPARGAAPADVRSGTKTWTVYLKVPGDWTPAASDTAASLLVMPVTTEPAAMAATTK
jgi:hypothetical protein